MPIKVHCGYQAHADLIALFRQEGKFGERFCSCGEPIQVGLERCVHSALVINGRSLCELCRNSDDGSRVHRVSQEQVEAYLDPLISDKELTAQEPQTAEPVVEFDGENFEQEEEQYGVVREE